MKLRCIVALLAAGLPLAATDATVAARAWREAHEQQIIEEFFGLLRLSNVAADADALRRNAETIRMMMERRGVASRLLEVPGAPPVVFGELPSAGAKQTVVFYAHYDGQPVQEKFWVGHKPFEPVLRDKPLEDGGRILPFPSPDGRHDPEWRIYARSASDDKAPILTLLAALDALKAANLKPSGNLKFVFEGEEEGGSPHLGAILAAHRDAVRADFWIICDGPVHQTRRQQICFGARGITELNVTVYGPRRELHSGHYGNWAPNPAMMLAQLVASMKDADGRVLVKGFYDGVEPLGEAERRAMSEEPPIDGELRRELWLGRTENAPRKLIDVINEPALNIRGLESAAVGAGSRNAIPAAATASIDIRLVKGNDPRAMLEKVKAHIRAQGYFVVDNREPTQTERMTHPRVARIEEGGSGYRAVRTPMDLPVSRQVIAAVEAARGPSVKMPTAGGSVPLALIEDVVGVPMILVPIANHDNNQHSHNENLRLRNLWDAIEMFASLFSMPGS